MSKTKGKTRDNARKKARNRAKAGYFLRRKGLRGMIRKWEDPILTQQCSYVNSVSEIKDVIRKLKMVLASTDNGVGLAASQIGYLVNVFAMRSDIDSGKITIFVNPEITYSEEKETGTEGCLSYPDFFTDIERSKVVTVTYRDENGNEHAEEFKGIESKIIQHEYDHTKGICLVGRAWQQQSLEGMPVGTNEGAATEDPQ